MAADVRLRLGRLVLGWFPARNRFREVRIMDDRTTMRWPPGRAVIRRCEAGRFQKELLARAYQHVSCEARRTLIDRAAAAREQQQQGHKVESLTAGRLLAKGA